MKTSLNQIRVELKEIASSHLQINEFYWGDLQDAQSKAVVYPLMNCYYANNGTNLNNNTSTINIVLEFCDLLYKDDSNLNDVESDLVQICRDVYQTINKSPRWKKLGSVQTATATKFKHGTSDVVACVSLSVSFNLRDGSGVCDLPMEDYDFDQDIPVGGCPQSRVVNTNLTFDQLIDAGDIYELQDITYNITNSEATVILSGSEVAQRDVSQVLPDVTHTDSNGLPVVYPSAKSFICTPATENGTALLLKSGEVGDNSGRDGDVLTLGAPLIDVNGNDFLNNTLERFTDLFGTQTYVDGIVIDRSTFEKNTGRVYGYNLDVSSSLTHDYASAVAAGEASNLGGFSGWQLTSKREQDNLDHYGIQGMLNFAPWNLSFIGTKYFYSRTEYAGNTSFFWLSRENANDQVLAKTTTNTAVRLLIARVFTWNGTILT